MPCSVRNLIFTTLRCISSDPASPPHYQCARYRRIAMCREPVKLRKRGDALKLGRRETISSAYREGYLPRGLRHNARGLAPAHERAVAILLAKLRGQPFHTEIPHPAALTRVSHIYRRFPVLSPGM